METTGLTVGGFIQPSVARNILDQPANAEKGLCQRFLWFVPQPTPIPFDELTKVNREFSASVGMLILHVPESKIMIHVHTYIYIYICSCMSHQ